MEILRMVADLDVLVARRATARDLRTVAVEKGFRPLVEEGIARILNGHTSIAEVARSVDLTQRFR
jgi:type II secretory ATPase GspE/PulE/Tfp pilus assembly ATPase PilB-like protein